MIDLITMILYVVICICLEIFYGHDAFIHIDQPVQSLLCATNILHCGDSILLKLNWHMCIGMKYFVYNFYVLCCICNGNM